MNGWCKIARVGAGAAATTSIVLGSWLSPLSSGAQTATTSPPPPTVEWAGFAGNAQHTAMAMTPLQPFHRIRWRAKVDLAPVLSKGTLFIHYGSPMITAANTVLVPAH
jgi:hypothetical protein